MKLSVVVPLYFEEENVELMHQSIANAISPLEIKYEIIFVDDGSTDNTFAIAKEIAKRDANLKVIKFRKNYGQTPAMAAGIDHAKGDIIITMDGDLQNDPADIPLLLQKIEEGYDIVVGWRHKRQDKLITRKIPSKIANWIIGKITGVPIKDNGCSLKAYKRSIIQQIPLYSEMHRFIPAMTSIAGTTIAEIKVRHHARQFGESKYGLSRVGKVLIDLLTIKTLISFASKPLYWFTLIALIPSFLGGLLITQWLFSIITDSNNQSFVFASIGILLIALSSFLVTLGVLAELVYKTGSHLSEKLSDLKLNIIGKNSNHGQ